MPGKLKRTLFWVILGLSLLFFKNDLLAFGEKPIDLAPKYQQGIVVTLKEVQNQGYEQIFSLSLQDPFLYPSSIKRFYLQVTGNFLQLKTTKRLLNLSKQLTAAVMKCICISPNPNTPTNTENPRSPGIVY
jgi:hypothetical protein